MDSARDVLAAAAVFTALLSSAHAGQQSPPSSQDASPAVPVPSTANAPEVDNPMLRPVAGELESKLDSKTAKPGDSIVVKTTGIATTSDGVVIPKGSKIVGHITDVETHEDGDGSARLTLQFDQAELKGGQNLPIKSVIQSVAPPAGVTGTDPTDALVIGSPRPAESVRGADSSGNAAPHGPAAFGLAIAPDAAASRSGALVIGTVVAKNGSVAVRTTAIPGVLLAANADGQPFPNASGALIGARQDIHLAGGTKVVLAIVNAGAGNNR